MGTHCRDVGYCHTVIFLISEITSPTMTSFLLTVQIVDYATRKAMPVAEVEKWLSSALAYDP